GGGVADQNQLRIPFDIHAHIPDDMFNRILPAGGYDAADDVAARVALMDRSGIGASVLMVPALYERPNGIADTRRVNDCVAWYRRAYPTRFPVAVGTVEPFHGRDVCLDEIQRITSELELDGVVWDHFRQGTAIDEPRMVAFVTELGRLGRPAFIHTHAVDEREHPARVAALARKVPETTIVALGALSSLQHDFELRRVAEEAPNLLFDTTVTLPIGPIARYVEIIGSERLLFGTDMYLNPMWSFERPPVLVDILQSRLSQQDRDNILWANAQRVFTRLGVPV
ncbi:MAG: amidohydrolase family protein, partial [Mycobacterium sp.]|nr:amidohydrolase family protein [Mycobacterium sp.]